VLGHRGVRGLRGEAMPAENTVEAFARAIADGADGVELDVRLSRDGRAVVVHDPTLARNTGGVDRRAVHEVDAAALASPAGGVRVPTLEEALDACRGRIVNVELKADVPARAALARAAVAAVRRAPRVEVVWSSFHPMLVLAAALLDPGAPRAILVGGRTRRLATSLPLAMRRLVTAAHVEDAACTDARVGRLARAGLRVAAWTVNDVERALSLVRAGVAWIITDRPADIVRALA
jgi:glycerophosphoryl diester phosphodiesterase